MIEYLKKIETISTLIFQLIKIGITGFKYIKAAFQEESTNPSKTEVQEEKSEETINERKQHNIETHESSDHQEIHIETNSNSFKITFIHDSEHVSTGPKQTYPEKIPDFASQIQFLQDLCHSDLHHIQEQQEICNRLAGDDQPLFT